MHISSISMARVALPACGFGLVLALNSFTLWGVPALLGPAATWPWAASEMSSTCLPANVLAFLAYGLAALWLPALSRRTPTLAACVALGLGAALLLGACAVDTAAWAAPLFKAAGLFLGVGGALSFICWEFAFAGLPLAEARASILAASVLAVVPYLALTFLAGDGIVYPLTLALVPACIVLLALGRRRAPDMTTAQDQGGDAGERTSAVETLAHLGRTLWMPVACTMMIGVIGPATGAFTVLGDMDATLRTILYQIANVAAVAVLAACWFGLRTRPAIVSAFLVLVPVLVVALFLFPFWSWGYHGFIAGLGCFIFSLVSILMMMSCIETSRQLGVGLGVVYGLFAGATYLAQVIGNALSDIVARSDYPRQFQVIAVVVLLLWGLSAVAFVAVWRGRAERGTGPSPAPAPAVPAGDTVHARCAALRERHGLTPREAEVLELIGRGRDTAAIADILGVSRNTVRTHVQRLYGDLGVHTRQELIDLIESDEPSI